MSQKARSQKERRPKAELKENRKKILALARRRRDKKFA
jgi:hypothetical protein